MCRDIKQMLQDVGREGHQAGAAAPEVCAPRQKDGRSRCHLPWAPCARGGWKANKHPSVGGQTPAFCSSARCYKPLPSLGFPEDDTTEGRGHRMGEGWGGSSRSPHFPCCFGLQQITAL